MKSIMEALMILCLCAAVGIMLYRFLKGRSVHKAMDRSAVITIGIGFIAGAVTKAIADPVEWTFVLYISGAMLCYTATLLSFPEKEEKHE